MIARCAAVKRFVLSFQMHGHLRQRSDISILNICFRRYQALFIKWKNIIYRSVEIPLGTGNMIANLMWNALK